MHFDAPDVGSTVGPWLLQEHVGSGSFGIVYRAQRVELPDSPPVAVKMARRPNDPRFEREAEILRRCVHPSIPRFVELGFWPGPEQLRYPYITMECVQGLTLYRWLQAQPRTHREVFQILAQLADALAYAHSRGALHRDVKGENIRVRSDGRAVLLDWGSGWFDEASPLTDNPAPPGTSAYRPPEQRAFQWEFRKDMEARWHSAPSDDLYALGVTLYRLVTGKYLPPCTDGGEPVARKVPPPSTLATVTPELETIILRLISDDRKVRGTAEQLAREITLLIERGGSALDLLIRPTASALATEEGIPPQSALDSAPLDEEVDEEVPDDEGPAEDEQPAASEPAQQERRAEVAPPKQDVARRPPELAVPVWLTWVGASVVGGLITALVLLPMRPAAPEPAPKPLPNPTPWLATPEEVAQFAPDAGVGEAALSSVENISPHGGEFVVSFGRPMPPRPFPQQRRPPCNRGEREINGGCWIKVDETEKPPCGADMFDYEGRCFFASFGENRRPTSGVP